MVGLYNKFWVALLMAVVAFLRARYDIDLGLDEDSAAALVGAVTAVLVYLVPNKLIRRR